MEISDIINAFEAFSNEGIKPREYYLIFSRKCWESEVFKANGYSFSKEELDAAEKLDVKLIGIRKGVKCYLPNNLIRYGAKKSNSQTSGCY